MQHSISRRAAAAIAVIVFAGCTSAEDETCSDGVAAPDLTMLQPFLDANKAVFHTEYVKRESQGAHLRDEVCGHVPAGFSTLVKLWELDAWYLDCP